MLLSKKDLLLYAVTDRSWLCGQTLVEQVAACLRGGATFLQLREKELPYEAFLRQARAIKELTDQYRIPFVINDNIEVALASDADGAHIGQADMAVAQARALLGKDKILGVSVQTVAEAVQAQAAGADYLGVGAVFATSTKADAATVSFAELQAICGAVAIPVVAIGGIGQENVSRLQGSGIAGIAVVSAIFAAPDIDTATRELKRKAEQCLT